VRAGFTASFYKNDKRGIHMDNTEFINSFFEYQKKGNWFLDLNPLTKLNILIIIGFTAFIVEDWKYTISMCIIAYIFAAISGVVKRFNSIFSKLLLGLGLFIVIVRQLSVQGNTVIFSIFGWQWTKEALLNGVTMGGKLLMFSAALVLFFQTTDTRDLMYSLEKKGISHEVSFVLLSSFQSIIDLKEDVNTIMESQKSRGIETEGNITRRMKAFLPIISPLLLGAMTSTELKSVAMDARAFSADTKHTFLREIAPVGKTEKIITYLIDALFIIAVITKIYLVIKAML